MPALRKTSAKAGFTLIEIMIVVLVIATLLAIALPNFITARETARGRACCETLRRMEIAKEQWAMTKNIPAASTPTANDLVSDFLKGTPGVLPSCPAGGTYSLNDLKTPPSCTIASNGTPEDKDDHFIYQ